MESTEDGLEGKTGADTDTVIPAASCGRARGEEVFMGVIRLGRRGGGITFFSGVVTDCVTSVGGAGA